MKLMYYRVLLLENFNLKAENNFQNMKLITSKKMVKRSWYKWKKIKMTTPPRKWIIST